MSLCCPKCGYSKPSPGECRRCGATLTWDDTEPPDPQVMIDALRSTRRSLYGLWAGLLVLELCLGAWFLAQPYLPKYAAGGVVSSALAGGMTIVVALAVLAPKLAWVCPCCGRELVTTEEHPTQPNRAVTRMLWNPESCPTCGVRLT